MINDKNEIAAESLFKEWDEIFGSYAALLRKRQTRKYFNSSNKFKTFLNTHGQKIGYDNSKKFEPKKFLIKETSMYFRQFLLDENAEGRLTIESCSQLLSCVNKILLFAEKNGLTRDTNLILTRINYTAEGNNRGHAAYSESEIESIKNGLKQEFVFIDYVIRNPDYVRTIDERKHYDEKFIEAVTLFEDPECLNKCPIPATNKNQALSKKHRRFFSLACSYPGGLAGFYRKIGVMDLVDARVVGSLLVKLAIETGYNPCSLFSLKTDCLVERSLPFGNPSIEFEKNRSGGFNTMPIILFDNDPVRMDLKKKQFQIIKKTINSIIAITSRLRKNVADELKPYLFIYESRSGRKFKQVVRFNDRSSSEFCKQLIKNYELKNDNGGPLKLCLVRFRPTRLTQMVKEGYDIFEIQAQAVHSNISSTINYINTHRIEPQLDAEVKVAVNKIYESFATTNKIILEDANESDDNPQVFKGLVSNCKNPYNPPDQIRGIQSYKKGNACTFFNMCLSCPNIIITNFHLPLLIVYRNQILNSELVKSNEGPHPHIYRKSLAILDSILNEENSFFTKDELDNAKRVAELHVDTVIDPLFHIPSKLKLNEPKEIKI